MKWIKNLIKSLVEKIKEWFKRDDDDPEPEPTPEPTPTPPPIPGAKIEFNGYSRTFTSDAADWKELKVYSNVSWTVTSNANWINPKTTSGKNDATVYYCIAANTSSSSRSGKLTVSGGGVSKILALTQKGKGSSPTPGPVENVINANKVVVWNEQSSANDYGMGGDVLARTGMIKGRTWRMLHGLYDAMPKDINAFVKSVANEGVKGLAIDTEGDLNNANNLRAIRNACNKYGVKLIGAPKGYCNPGGEFPAGNFANSVKLFQEIFDAVLIWSYGCDGAKYEAIIKDWRDCGFTKQIGVFQDQIRDSNGYMGKYYWKDVAQHAKNGGYPFCLFLPNHSSSAQLAELKNIFK